MKIAVFLFGLMSTLQAGIIEDESFKMEVCSVLPSIPGWCSVEKAQHFMDLVIKEKPRVCVEIGVFGGASLFPVASALKYVGHGKVIAIDPWDKTECAKNYDPIKDAEHIAWWSQVNMAQLRYSFLKLLSQHDLEPYCITLRMSSELAAPLVDSVDILYLDGNHSEASNLLDVTLYLPKVNSGGHIWFNDSLWDSAQSALDILFEECDVVSLVDDGNCILFKKR